MSAIKLLAEAGKRSAQADLVTKTVRVQSMKRELLELEALHTRIVSPDEQGRLSAGQLSVLSASSVVLARMSELKAELVPATAAQALSTVLLAKAAVRLKLIERLEAQRKLTAERVRERAAEQAVTDWYGSRRPSLSAWA